MTEEQPKTETAGDAAASTLRALLQDTAAGALATLHRGDPAASMVPFAHDAAAGALLIHVSELATHTRDMRAHPAVSLLVMAAPGGDVPPQALARVAFAADARFVARDAPEYAAGRKLYLARFPQSVQTFALGDFSLVALLPRSARVVGGFGQAASLAGDALARALRG